MARVLDLKYINHYIAWNFEGYRVDNEKTKLTFSDIQKLKTKKDKTYSETKGSHLTQFDKKITTPQESEHKSPNVKPNSFGIVK